MPTEIAYAQDIATLRNTTQVPLPPSGTDKLVWVKWYRTQTTQYLGGGGLFRWDALASADDNGGTIILPTGHTGNGRWIRDSVRDALDFGADPTFNYSTLSGTDSAPFLQKYMEWARDNNQEVILPKGVFYLGSFTLPAITKRMVIRGAGMQNTILVPNPNATGDVFKVEDTWREVLHTAFANKTAYESTADQGVTIQDLSIISKASKVSQITDNPEVRGVVTFGRVSELRLLNIQFGWLKTAVSLGREPLGTTSGVIRESTFSNLHAVHCGSMDTNQNPQSAAFEIGVGAGAGEDTSDLSFDQCSVVYPEGWGFRIENLSTTVAIQRLRFSSIMLHGSSQKDQDNGGLDSTETKEAKASVMLVEGKVVDLEMMAVDMNGSTGTPTTGIDKDYACIELNEKNGSRPEYVTIIGDIRVCDGVGIWVRKCNVLNAQLTVEQAGIGGGSKAAVKFDENSVAAGAGARIRALSSYTGTPLGARIDVDPTMRPYVLVERSSGDITGMHMQRIIKSTDGDKEIKYYDETILVDIGSPPTNTTIKLPKLSDVTMGQEFLVLDGSGNASQASIIIETQGSDLIEVAPGSGQDQESIDSNWGKRGFRAISNLTTSLTPTRWVTWEPSSLPNP